MGSLTAAQLFQRRSTIYEDIKGRSRTEPSVPALAQNHCDTFRRHTLPWNSAVSGFLC